MSYDHPTLTPYEKRKTATRYCKVCGKILPFLYKGDFCRGGKCYKKWYKGQNPKIPLTAK